MKIGILTFHASHNYGSMLQAYALQRFLKDHGHEPEFINFRSKVQKLMYAHPFDFRYKYKIKETIYNALHTPQVLWPRYKRWVKHEKFLKQHLSLSQEYNTEEEIKQCADKYDLIIVGSDQIWNTNALDFSTAYFADFSNTKKISYAASLGSSPERCDKILFKKYLPLFSSISVREERSKDFLSNECGIKNIDVVLDPVLLHDKSTYEIFIDKKPIVTGDYIFYYTPKGYGDNIRNVCELGQKLGLKVITDKYYPNAENVTLLTLGPSEFLNVIRNATVVCGQSFHLAAFSILFHKNYYCTDVHHDSRIDNLLQKLRIENRNITKETIDKVEAYTCSIDYDRADELLERQRQYSVNKLLEMID